jgi:peptidase E
MPRERTRHIVAMGGGGFSMEPDDPRMDDFVLSLARRQPAHICFVPTASGDAATYVAKFYRAFGGRACAATDLTLFGSSALPRRPAGTNDLASFVLAQDVIYVGGGNTANLLALWRTHGLDRVFRAAWEQGVVLSGLSAGMLCWFEASVTDSFGGLARLDDGIGLLKGSACPHYDGEPTRRPAYRELIGAGFPAGYGVDNGAALHFVGETLAEVVTTRAGACAYRVRRDGGQVVEERVEARLLASP